MSIDISDAIQAWNVKIPTADIPVTQSPSILYTLAPLSFLLCPYILGDSTRLGWHASAAGWLMSECCKSRDVIRQI